LTAGRRHALAVLLAVVVGAGLWRLWWWAGYPAGGFVRGLAGHGPDPLAWPRFLAVWPALAQVAFAAAYAALARGDPRVDLRRHADADQLALGLLLGLAVLLAALGGRGPWRLLIGIAYVAFVGTKTAIFLHALWRWLSADPHRARGARRAVFLGALLPYLLLDGWVATASSTSGDEPFYLLLAHSLLHDRDSNLANNLAAQDYRPFYWGPLDATRNVQTTPDRRVYSVAHAGLQPFLLLPGYALAGRVGAMATVSALAAAALALAFGLARAQGASPRAAFLAWIGMAFGVPVLSYAGPPWPEMPAAFFLVLATVPLLGPRTSAGGYAVVAGSLAALFVLKSRFLLVIGAVVLGLVRQLTWRAVGALGAVLVALLVAAIAYDAAVTGGFFFGYTRRGGLLDAAVSIGSFAVQPLIRARGLVGFLLDQEHGVLLTAPAYALALAGVVVAAVERRWRLLVLTTGPFAACWYVLGGIASGGVPLWFAGFNPPARYVVAALPLLLVPMALALDRVNGRLGWAGVAALWTWTLAYATLLTVWPAWRFQDNLGRATVLAGFWRWSGLDAGGVLPAYVPPGSAWVAPGAVLLLLVLGVGWRLAGRQGSAPMRRDVVAGVAAAGLGVAALLGYVAWRPWGIYPAAVWEGGGGTNFRGVIPVDTGEGPRPAERLVWAAQRDGVIQLAPRLPAGRYRLAVRAGAQASDAGPALTLNVAGASPMRVVLDAAAPPAWREREYATEIRWTGGRLPVRLELREISGHAPVRLAYLAHLAIVRLGP